MKYLKYIVSALLYCFVCMLLLSSCEESSSSDTSTASVTQEDSRVGENTIRVGMDFKNFQKKYPQANLNSAEQWKRRDTLYGAQGEWTYSFSNNKLVWFIFQAKSNEISVEEFQTFLTSTERLIEAYSLINGSPQTNEEGLVLYQDPAKYNHNGYKVVEASWKNEFQNTQVDFSFLGANNNYTFLITIQSHG